MPLPSNVQRIVTGGSYLHIASAVPTRYSVAVRPLQNKQGVDTPIISEVVSGGGGVAPTNQILFEDNVNLLTTKFIITEPIENTNKLAVKAYSPTTGEQEQLIYPSFVGKKATFPTQTADLITLEGTDNVTYGVGNGSSVNITPSFVAASSPEPSHIKFALSAATNDTTNENDEDY